MIVNKCDNCGKELTLDSEDWIHLSSQGFLLSIGGKPVAKGQVLDFCDIPCMVSLLDNLRTDSHDNRE